MATICVPRYRSDGVRLLGGCIGPQDDWAWTTRRWWDEKQDQWSVIEYAMCGDCEMMWDRGGGFVVSTPQGPRERTMFRSLTNN